MIEKYFCLLLLSAVSLAQFESIFEKDQGDLTGADGRDHRQEIQETMKLLKSGDKVIKIDDNYRDLIMMLGNTGTGKSTLTRFVAGNLEDLTSVDDGEFKIEYKYKDVIGSDTTVSQTIYPELVIDDLGNPYYDNPGYDDTRNTSIEIAATYFVKRVVDHANSIKLILVANYDAVRVAGHRTDFVKLVEHIHQFVKNISLYKDSIALIATKVENQPVKVGGNFVIRSDEEMTLNIVRFLTEYRARMEKEEPTPFTANALALVDILLTTKDNGKTYDKLGLFRKPDEAGTLDKIDLMVQGRRKLRDLIVNRTVYTTKVGEHFGYTLSDNSKLKIIDLVNEINTGITQDVRSIGEAIQAEYKKNSQIGSLLERSNYFLTGHTKLSAIVSQTKDLTSSLLVSRLIDILKDLNVSNSNEHIAQISNQEHYINFLQNFTTKKLPINPNDWVTGLKDCIVYLEDSKNWYKFLADIYEDYSQYEFRKELARYNVADVNDWGQDGKPQGIHINADNFWTFVQKQKNAELIKNERPDELKLKLLNELLDITLKQAPVVTCEKNSKLLIKGDYVRLNDVNFTLCGDGSKQIHIFALHTVFIDKDIDGLGKRLEIAILAPKWYIWGDHTINLNGIDATNVADKPATAGTTPNGTADAGLPGKPGGNAGSFFGLGLKFFNGEKLKINAIAGKGGRGQDGGAGLSASDPDVSNLATGSKEGGWELDQKPNIRFKIGGQAYCKRIVVGRSNFVEECETKWGVYGNCGGSAGDGGSGGYGGLAGATKILELGVKSSIAIRAENGAVGDGGTGGSTGRNPKMIYLRYTRIEEFSGLGFKHTKGTWEEVGRVVDETCPSIRVSVNGANVVGIANPESLSLIESDTLINEFKDFGSKRDVLSHDDLKKSLQQIEISQIRVPL